MTNIAENVSETIRHVFFLNDSVRARLYGGGTPQIGEVTCGKSPHLSCKRDQLKKRDSMDWLVNPPKQVTSPTWGPPPPCKQALKGLNDSRSHYD